jgi:hypothetical protein
MICLGIGKCCGAAKVPRGNSGISAPPRARSSSESREFSLGSTTSTSVPNAPTVLPLPRSRPDDWRRRRRARCHQCHAPNHDQCWGREGARQALGHARTLRRRMAPSDHGDTRLGQHLGISANPQNERRIIDFLQARRVRRIVQSRAGDVGRRGLLQSVAWPVPRTCPGPTTGQRRFRCQRSPVQSEQARKTASADPRCLTSLRDFVGPRRGSRDGQPLRKMTPCGRSSGVRQNALRADSNSAERGGRESKSEVTIGFVKIVENATFTYFRHFLP